MDKCFLITIDTEGDNLWNVSDIGAKVTTQNAAYLYRFQEVCEKYGFVPTYLTNYEMARNKEMINLGRQGISNHSLEIGMHIHAWNQPPVYPLFRRLGKAGKPYLGEYPFKIITNKIDYQTKLLQDTFQCPIQSHRGGRWYLDSYIIKELDKLGFIVDCTCTPGISWKNDRGLSYGSGGTDWSNCKNKIFRFLYKEDGHTRRSSLIEIPVTIDKIRENGNLSWFRPNGRNLNEMICLMDLQSRKSNYIEFMIHSSELMPGGSPSFEKKWQITRLYDDLEIIFEYAQKLGYRGMGISEYAEKIAR